MTSKSFVKTCAVVAAAGAALLVPAAASAANPVPNPGFEGDCGGIPCNWHPLAGTLARDTANPHTGNASLRLTVPTTAAANQANTQSDCTNTAIPAGARTVGFWYRANTGVSAVAMIVNFWNATGCGTGPLGQQTLQTPTGSANTSGAWTLLTGNMTIPAGVQSFKVTLSVGCTSCSGTGAPRIANFDDVSLEGAPTAVTVTSFRGAQTAKGVRLTWKTAAMPQLAGFNVYRGATKLNRSVIHALGSRTFSWVDRSARGGAHAQYRLEAVYLDGTRAWVGSTRV